MYQPLTIGCPSPQNYGAKEQFSKSALCADPAKAESQWI
jgi:hypothetical protein